MTHARCLARQRRTRPGARRLPRPAPGQPSLRRDGRSFSKREAPLDGSAGDRAHQYGARTGGRLQPRRGVHGIAADDGLALGDAGVAHDERLARADPDADSERRAGSGARHGSYCLNDLQRGEHRTLRIVFACHGRSEHAHHGVAHVLLDRAAEALDRGASDEPVRLDDRPHVLGVAAVGEGGEAHQIAEQHAHELALARHRSRWSERRAAPRAVPRPFRGLETAARAGDHRLRESTQASRKQDNEMTTSGPRNSHRASVGAGCGRRPGS